MRQGSPRKEPKVVGSIVYYVYSDFKMCHRVMLPYGTAPTLCSQTTATGGANPLQLIIKRKE